MHGATGHWALGWLCTGNWALGTGLVMHGATPGPCAAAEQGTCAARYCCAAAACRACRDVTGTQLKPLLYNGALPQRRLPHLLAGSHATTLQAGRHRMLHMQTRLRAWRWCLTAAAAPLHAACCRQRSQHLQCGAGTSGQRHSHQLQRERTGGQRRLHAAQPGLRRAALAQGPVRRRHADIPVPGALQPANHAAQSACRKCPGLLLLRARCSSAPTYLNQCGPTWCLSAGW
jgi:hypothetical protein